MPADWRCKWELWLMEGPVQVAVESSIAAAVEVANA